MPSVLYSLFSPNIYKNTELSTVVVDILEVERD